MWDDHFSIAQLREPGRVACFAAKWEGENRVMFYSEFHDGREKMLQAARRLLDEADAVVHYNGKAHDIKHLQTEIVLAGMTPPSPAAQIDLYLTVKKRFKFPSNKLEYVLKAFGLPAKLKSGGHELWVACMAGDPKAWDKMKRYCKGDVVPLEMLHDKLKPWLASSPNLRLVDGTQGCPRCGADELVKEGFRYTNVGKFQRYSCSACGSWSTDSRRVEGTDVGAMVW